MARVVRDISLKDACRVGEVILAPAPREPPGGANLPRPSAPANLSPPRSSGPAHEHDGAHDVRAGKVPVAGPQLVTLLLGDHHEAVLLVERDRPGHRLEAAHQD